MSLTDRLWYFSLGIAFTLQVLALIKQIKEFIKEEREFKAWEAEMDRREKELAAEYRKLRELSEGKRYK